MKISTLFTSTILSLTCTLVAATSITHSKGCGKNESGGIVKAVKKEGRDVVVHFTNGFMTRAPANQPPAKEFLTLKPGQKYCTYDELLD